MRSPRVAAFVVAAAFATLATSSITHAAPASRCKPAKGAPIFEARWFSPDSRVLTKLYASGLWIRDASSPGHTTVQQRGCIEGPELDEIKTALAAASWKKTKPQAKCNGDGDDVELTDVYTGGKRRFTIRNCGGYELDDKTNTTIERIAKELPDGFEGPPPMDSIDF